LVQSSLKKWWVESDNRNDPDLVQSSLKKWCIGHRKKINKATSISRPIKKPLELPLTSTRCHDGTIC
jgi:hypothetical protein